ncbi:7-carboxy-7-deazaguanine synthase [bacterium HR30]|nr:7-carboxy-7-deazaguanine synthase [bacterium HR30]
MDGYLSEIFVSFQGEGARVGERHLFVRLAGCNLRCRYCDTPDSLERRPLWYYHDPATGQTSVRPNPVSAGELLRLVADLCEQDPSLQMIALTGGEPLLQAKFLREFLVGTKLSLPVLLETNGVLPQQLALVLPSVHVISMDIKLPSNAGERAFWDEHRAFLELAKSRECYVKVLIDWNTSVADVEQAARIVSQVAPQVPLFLQPIVDGEGRFCADSGTLSALFGIARRHHESVRVLPQVHKVLGIP